MLYSHERSIYAKIFQHHIVYNIPTYSDFALPNVISLVEKSGSLELSVRRKDPTAFGSGTKLIPGIYNRGDGDLNKTDANGGVWIHEEEWKLPL